MNTYETLREEHDNMFYRPVGVTWSAKDWKKFLDTNTNWWLSKIESIEKEAEARTIKEILNMRLKMNRGLSDIDSNDIKEYAASRGIEIK